MDAETTITFTIEGDKTAYEVPPVDELDMAEWQVLYEYTGLTLDDFLPPAKDEEGRILDEDAEKERQRRLGQPALNMALFHIGYQRAHSEMTPGQIKALVGKANGLRVFEEQLEQFAALLKAAKEAKPEVPLDMTSEREKSSPRSSLDSDEKTMNERETGSKDLENVSDEQDEHLAITGTGV